MKPLRILLVTGIAIAALSAQQIITLRDGTRYNGRVVRSDSNSVTFVDQSGRERTVDAGQVDSIVRDQNYDNRRGYEQTAPQRNYDQRNDANVLPAGTEIAVRVNENIDTRNSNPDQTYGASIARDVTDQSGNVAIPKGSWAELVVRKASTGGTVGTPELVLDLEWVEVNGQRYRLDTADLERRGNQGIGANRRTGEMVGGGALLGTLLGALGGGGKGAAIGAIAGAAAGGAVQVITRGKEVRVPAETVLTFKLDQPESLYRTTRY